MASSSALPYEVTNRVYGAARYPLRTADGATLIVYGHSHGLTFLWTAGSKAAAASNSSYDEIDNSDDEEDPNSSSSIFSRSLDVPLGSAALHIAFAPLTSQSSARDTARKTPVSGAHVPAILSQEAVVAVACADASIHLVTVSLTASRHKDHARAQDQMRQHIIVKPPVPKNTVRSVADAISMTWTADISLTEHEAGDLTTATSESTEPQADNDHPPWAILIATTSSEASGLLQIYGVSIGAGEYLVKSSVSILKTEYLSAFAHTVRFRPTAFPSKGHSELLVADAKSFVRLYDPIDRVKSTGQKHPAWLVSFRASVDQLKPSGASGAAPRQTAKILDAEWAFAGTSIVILLSNGHWGVWSVFGSATNAQQSSSRASTSVAGNSLTGAGINDFTLKGYVGRSSATHSQNLRLGAATESEAEPKKLAPMTPNTRKAKQEKLFKQQQQPGKSSISTNSASLQGGLSITSTTFSSSAGASDDSLVIWYAGEVFAVPSLRDYWQKAASRETLAANRSGTPAVDGTLFGATISPLSNFSTGGETITMVAQLPASAVRGTIYRQPTANRHDLLISAEHRIISIAPTRQEKSLDDDLSRLFLPLHSTTRPEYDAASKRVDQDLLMRGDLDLGGMDRMLDGMANRKGFFRTNGATSTNKRKVGFSADY